MSHSELLKRIIVIALLIVALLIPVVTSDPYYLHIMIMFFLNAALALSLWVIMSIGHLHIAHAAFAGIGSYTSALLVMRAGLSFWLALPLAGVVAAIIALSLGYVILKVKVVYFAMLTVCLGEVFRIIITAFPDTLGGMTGIPGVPKPDSLSFGVFSVVFTTKTPYFYLVLFFCLVTLIVMYRIHQSHLGRVMTSIAECDYLAESIGINTINYKVLAFVIGSFFAGMAGSISTHYLTACHPHFNDMMTSIRYIMFVIVGGSGSIIGPVVGALVLTMVPEVLRQVSNYEPFVYAGILIFVIIFMPEGLVSLFRWWKSRLLVQNSERNEVGNTEPR